MKIIFMGTPQFGAQILEELLQGPHDVIAVVTQPDRPKGRKRILTPSPVKELALAHDIPVYQPEKISGSPEAKALIDLESDLIVTAAYGQFVPTDVLNAPKKYAINVHASLLPKYRGGAPIHYAIWKGESETGISIIEMVKKMDAGDIFKQGSISIEKTDDVGILFEKLAVLGRQVLRDTLEDIEAGREQRYAQDPDLVTFSPNIAKEEEQIQWQQTAQEVDCHIRGFRPFPSTYTIHDGQRLKIWAGYPLEQPLHSGQSVGTVVDSRPDGLVVQCGQGSGFVITQWQESGKKAMNLTDVFNGSPAESFVGHRYE